MNDQLLPWPVDANKAYKSITDAKTQNFRINKHNEPLCTGRANSLGDLFARPLQVSYSARHHHGVALVVLQTIFSTDTVRNMLMLPLQPTAEDLHPDRHINFVLQRAREAREFMNVIMIHRTDGSKVVVQLMGSTQKSFFQYPVENIRALGIACEYMAFSGVHAPSIARSIVNRCAALRNTVLHPLIHNKDSRNNIITWLPWVADVASRLGVEWRCLYNEDAYVIGKVKIGISCDPPCILLGDVRITDLVVSAEFSLIQTAIEKHQQTPLDTKLTFGTNVERARSRKRKNAAARNSHHAVCDALDDLFDTPVAADNTITPFDTLMNKLFNRPPDTQWSKKSPVYGSGTKKGVFYADKPLRIITEHNHFHFGYTIVVPNDIPAESFLLHLLTLGKNAASQDGILNHSAMYIRAAYRNANNQYKTRRNMFRTLFPTLNFSDATF